MKDYYGICNGFFLVNARINCIITKYDVYSCSNNISSLQSIT
jgi:hypothetical protein